MSACPVFGFLVRIVPAPALDVSGITAFRDAFDGALAAHGLVGSGEVGPEGGVLEIRGESAQATHDDRVFVEGWLAARPDVARATVGDLLDLSTAS